MSQCYNVQFIVVHMYGKRHYICLYKPKKAIVSNGYSVTITYVYYVDSNRKQQSYIFSIIASIKLIIKALN
jgi:hypothetical protein